MVEQMTSASTADMTPKAILNSLFSLWYSVSQSLPCVEELRLVKLRVGDALEDNWDVDEGKWDEPPGESVGVTSSSSVVTLGEGYRWVIT